jgi:hypothetical protein
MGLLIHLVKVGSFVVHVVHVLWACGALHGKQLSALAAAACHDHSRASASCALLQQQTMESNPLRM